MSKHVKMLKTASGSENGIAIAMYTSGQDYELSDRLAQVFVEQMGVAVYIESEDEDFDFEETKMIPSSPENKMVHLSEDKDSDIKRKIKFRRS